MINRFRLLADLKPIVKAMEADLRGRCDEVDEISTGLKQEYDEARAAERTGVTFEEWRADLMTQVAVAWVLSCVFVRFLEDNGLIEPPRISGPLHDHGSGGLQRARDEWDIYLHGTADPTHRGYLLKTFDDLAKLPGAKDVFGPHNLALSAAYRNWLSGDAAQKLIEFFQKIDADGTGEIVHDFTDAAWDTRFLGDLYQDLSEAARKKYALLQTPEFVEEFILERTLEPAIEEFGLGEGSLELRSLELRSLELRNDTSTSSLSSKNQALSSKNQALSSKNQALRSKNQALSSKNQALSPSFRMIDPACGSGHFLLGSFARILKRWRAKEPGASDRELVNRALASVHGVDLNPYAVAIARFRLLLAAMRECDISRLDEGVPGFKFNLACGDSLLHGSGGSDQILMDHAEYAHHYQGEDIEELRRILQPGRYHAVVANPPYITPKDKALNQAYRERYSTCHMKYALTVPFMQRLFQLAVSGYGDAASQGGYVGQITSNSFMKREFGKKIIEQYLAGRDGGPSVDLTHVIDTSGAYIPGHGTPTVILFGRNRAAVRKTIRTVMGIRGEPSTPPDPARGHVWSAIVDQIDRPGSQSEFVSVADSSRELFARHPWSIGGGGAAELKEQLENGATLTLNVVAESIGFASFTGQDEAFVADRATLARCDIPAEYVKQFVVGDSVRDWATWPTDCAFAPYDSHFQAIDLPARKAWTCWMWPMRAAIGSVLSFGGKTRLECGDKWWTWYRWVPDKYRTPLSIVFAFVATHNHFVLDRGGKVFNRSAPVIKLPPEATEDDHLALLGLLNSSTACFWMKQVFHDKGSSVDSHGARQTTIAFENFREFTATGLVQFPLPAGRPLALARKLDEMAGLLAELSPGNLLRAGPAEHNAEILAERRCQWEAVRQQMIALQEELDWECYGLYGLVEQSLVLSAWNLEKNHTTGEAPAIELGERAFEIVLARRMARGEVQSTWFQRHGSTPITEMPGHWPEEYRRLVERRIELMETDPNIGLIEQPEYKRRWNTEPWDAQLQRALRDWLLDRLESYFDFDGRMGAAVSGQKGAISYQQSAVNKMGEAESCSPIAESRPLIAESSVTTVARLADVARADRDFMQVAELFTGRMDFEVGNLVAELVAAESVPALPVLRYKPSGMDKRAAWERTWELQREEDQESLELRSAELRSVELRSLELRSLELRSLELRSLELSGETEGEEPGSTHNDLSSRHYDLSSKIEALKSPIPVPPKYTSADFLNSAFWKLRGKLDVPKERWVSFPHCEGEDATLVIAWAGYDHLQMARAIAERYELAKEQEGRKLVPLLAAIGQLIPWLKQWHNDLDPAYGTRMGDYFESYLTEEAKALGMAVEQVMAWTPPEKAKKAGKKKKASK